jgi:hypothetical protein
VTTPGVYTGTLQANVRYKRASDGMWVSATNITTPNLSTTGMKSVAFDSIKASDIMLTDSLTDPITGEQDKCIHIWFSGAGTVTTAPLFSYIWKQLTHSMLRKAINSTDVYNQGDNPDFSALPISLMPAVGDLVLFGFQEIPVRLFFKIYDMGGTADYTKEWVYSKAGNFAQLDPSKILDETNNFEVTIPTSPSEYISSLVIPNDISRLTLTDMNDETFNLYWIGMRVTDISAITEPVAPAHITMRAQVAKNPNADGIPAEKTQPITKMTLIVRETSQDDNTF